MTDNTEAVEKLAELLYSNMEFEELDVKAILAAIQADPLAYVKPKPLEWRTMTEQFTRHVKNHWVCESTNHMYQIYDCGGYWRVQMGALVIKFDSCFTLEAAQAAAETHRNEMLAKEFAQ